MPRLPRKKRQRFSLPTLETLLLPKGLGILFLRSVGSFLRWGPYSLTFGYIYYTGWWFGTFFIFPYIEDNHPNWLIFFRGVDTTNQLSLQVLSGTWTTNDEVFLARHAYHAWLSGTVFVPFMAYGEVASIRDVSASKNNCQSLLKNPRGLVTFGSFCMARNESDVNCHHVYQ